MALERQRQPAAAAHAHAHGEGWARERCRLELSSARRESETSIMIYGYVGNCKCGTIADDGMGCEMHPIPTAWKRDGQPHGRAGMRACWLLAAGCWRLMRDDEIDGVCTSPDAACCRARWQVV